MPSTTFALAPSWDVANRYTAASDVDVLLTNSGNATMVFEITTSDSIPALSVGDGHQLLAGANRAMQLKAGYRLWLASLGAGGSATFLADA